MRRRRYCRPRERDVEFPIPIAIHTLEEYDAVQQFLEERDKRKKEEEEKKKKKKPFLGLPENISFPTALLLMTFVGPWAGVLFIKSLKAALLQIGIAI